MVDMMQRFQPYFDKVWKMQRNFVRFCKILQLTEKGVICHAEGYRKGIAGIMPIRNIGFPNT